MKHIREKKPQYGLSLLMTMIVIAIIGILAEVALLAYEESVVQEQVLKK